MDRRCHAGAAARGSGRDGRPGAAAVAGRGEGGPPPLLAAPALGPHITASVVDVATGQILFASEPDAAMTPASTTKVVTAVAALAARGPAYRIPTRVVAGAQPGEVVIVAGGDPTLAVFPTPFYPGAARLDDLAAQVKKALGDTAPTKVIYDLSVFTGSGIGPGWDADATTAGSGAVITPLMTEGGRPHNDKYAKRYPQPDVQAAQAFAQDARAAGRSPPSPGRRRRAPRNSARSSRRRWCGCRVHAAGERQRARRHPRPAGRPRQGPAGVVRGRRRRHAGRAGGAEPARDRRTGWSTAAGSPATTGCPRRCSPRSWRWPPAPTAPTCTRSSAGCRSPGTPGPWPAGSPNRRRVRRRRPGPGQDGHAHRRQRAHRHRRGRRRADPRVRVHGRPDHRPRQGRVALDRVAAALAACGCR